MIVLAGDLGGTRNKLGVVSARRVLAHTVRPARAKQGLARQLPVLKSAWLELLADTGLRTVDCAGISMAFPSLMEPGTGRILGHFGKYADAPGLDLRHWAWTELNLPLAIENDARMALMGERLAGAGRGCDNLGILTLGTGLGTAVLIHGRLLRGPHGWSRNN
jgi:glucokinase